MLIYSFRTSSVLRLNFSASERLRITSCKHVVWDRWVGTVLDTEDLAEVPEMT
jgi:hypothetical protein